MWRPCQALLPLLLCFSLGQTDPLRINYDCMNVARPTSRPYMVVLFGLKSRPICGGFLVGKQWVMTSARCEGVSSVYVAGNDLNGSGGFYKVANTYRHRDFYFQNKTFSNDIRLVKLSWEVHLNEYVGILPLPSSDSHLTEGTSCIVAGWNINKLVDCKFQLYDARVDIYDQRKCQKFYPKIDFGKICAGEHENAQAFQQGEMGDPLVCNGVVRGILSYSNPCPPAVYTDIAKYLRWIEKTMTG